MPTFPFVIDNQQHTMAEVLNALLAQYQGHALDIATAYFNAGGWQMLREGLSRLGNFRLLLGDEPEDGADLGLRDGGAKVVKGLIRELSAETFNERTLRLIEDLIAFLRQEQVQVRLYTRGFLHAKSYLFYSGGGFERFAPVAAIVGSSNFTSAGLKSNKELNLVHRANLAPEEIGPAQVNPLLEAPERQRLAQLDEAGRLAAANLPGILAINELAAWFERQWENARDFKDDLIDLLDASKFGRKAYTPYDVYMKAIYEYFRDDLDAENSQDATRSAVELSEFQDDAVRRARKILARYDGVLVADSVGLGKTWIGKKLLEDYAYHLRYRAVVICPAALQSMWEKELRGAAIAAQIVTQEALGREEFDIREVQDADIFLIDESHNFRNHNAQRYGTLERILAANNRRGTLSGERKKLILLTATPINNSIFDLFYQVNLFSGGDRGYFAAAGIGDLWRYFQAARRASRQQESGIALFNLLEEVVIRRTRPFIKSAYPNATINGKPIHWPERTLKTVRYNLEATYGGIYERIVTRIEGLRLAPYRLESYKKPGTEPDRSEMERQFEVGREEALVGIFKSRYLKRFESSIDAFRISVRRALEFLETFESYILEGRVLDSASFQKALRYLSREDEEDDATPSSRADHLDAHDEARQFIETLPALDASRYDLRRLHTDLRRDVEALRHIWQDSSAITPAQDAKLARLKDLLAGDLKGQKVLLFTYYKDTARYLYRQLRGDDPEAAAWRAEAGEPHIRGMDSGVEVRERARIVAHFAPRANQRDEIVGSEQEIDLLISTDVLSEGQNLQDCGVLINYDLHWNPTRMVQRAGRIDRIGTDFDTLAILNLFPDDGLERLLGLVESLSRKISTIDQSGFLDASILGEVVHPQNFNTLRRIEDEDRNVVEEQEQFVELVSSEFLLQQLKGLLDSGMREKLEALPDGNHSGLAREEAKGVFFYFTAQPKPLHTTTAQPEHSHFWRYLDLAQDWRGGRIEDNRYVITNLIQCQPDTPRVVPLDREVDIFALQEQVIDSIIHAAQEQVAVQEAPKLLDPIQQTIATTLRSYLNSPSFSRKEIVALLQWLAEPQPSVYIKALRKASDTFQVMHQPEAFVNTIRELHASIGGASRENAASNPAVGERPGLVQRQDLRLICFEYVWE
ncbi:MAG: helicase-related protein [Ktedonobacteraceae bacterium]